MTSAALLTKRRIALVPPIGCPSWAWVWQVLSTLGMCPAQSHCASVITNKLRISITGPEPTAPSANAPDTGGDCRY